jgi:hypothetical protein
MKLRVAPTVIQPRSGRISTQRVHSFLLACVVAVYLLLTLFYLAMVPTGESPDEPGHLQCIEQVARDRRLPRIEPRPRGEWWSRETIISGRMCYHMPLYYVTAGGLYWAVHKITGAPLHYEFPSYNPEWGNSPALFAHDSRLFLERPKVEPATVTMLRLFAICLGGIILWATYHATQLLFRGNRWPPLAAVALLAGWPQFLYMVRSISNDILASALAAIVLIVLLRSERPGRFVWAALLAVLAVLTKLNVTFLLAVVFLTLGYAYWHARPAERLDYRKATLLSFIPVALLVFVLAWVPPINTHFQLSRSSFLAVSPNAGTLTYWWDVLKLTLSSGYARFGWMNLPAPFWQATAWWGALLLFLVLGLRQLAQIKEHQVKKRLFFLVAVWFAGALFAYWQINVNRFQPQFRFLFPMLPLVAALAGAGFVKLSSDLRIREPIAIAVLLLLLLGLNFWILYVVVYGGYWPG